MTQSSDPTRRVAQGAFLLMSFQIISKAFYLVFFILLGNRSFFSEHDYGRLEGLLATANLFFIFADLGIETLLTRDLARDRENLTRNLPGIVTLKLLLTLAACGLLLVWNLAAGKGGEGTKGFLVLLGCAVFLAAVSAQSFLRSISRAHQRMRVEGVMGVVEKILTLLLGGSLLLRGADVFGIMWAVSLAAAAAAGYGFLKVRSFQKGLVPGTPPAFPFLKKALPFGLSAVCVLLFYNLDRLMLFYFGDVWAARYARGFRIVMGLLLFPQMMSISIYPMLSKLKRDPERRVEVGRDCLQTLLFIAFPLVTGGWAVAGPLVDFLYGSAGPGSLSWRLDPTLGWDSLGGNRTESAVLRILLLGLPFTCCNYLFGPALNALDKETWNLKASAATAGANVVANGLLIPLLGPVGAAGATTLTQGLYSLCLYRLLRRMDSSWFLETRWKKLAGIAVLMGTAVYLLPEGWVPVKILGGGALYLVLCRVTDCWPVRLNGGAGANLPGGGK